MHGKMRYIEATSESLMDAVYRLRYEIYVKECGFERADEHPGGKEKDIYDPSSIHFVALTGEQTVVATIRMILDSSVGFPTEDVANTVFLGEKPASSKISEVSRLAVLPSYRRRPEKSTYDPVNIEVKGTAEESLIVLSLVGCVYYRMKRMGITHMYIMMERKLYRMLSKFGLLFHQIGEPVDYHGIRSPYLGIIAEMEEYAIRKNAKMLMHPAFRAALKLP
jgi:N-acyl amino acid synthase of PEP-CTERM/exosortase system